MDRGDRADFAGGAPALDVRRTNKHGGFGMLQRLFSLTDQLSLGHHRVRALLLAPAAAMLMGLGGCVAQQGYDQAMAENRSLKDQNQQLLADSQQARSEAEIERAQRQRAEAALASMEKQYGVLSSNLDQAMAGANSLNDRLGRIQLLDPATNNALQALADQYPDLITFDAQRGLLRFASDLTFDSGSDAVKAGAKESLVALAKILNSAPAARYEVHIVGHTDAQPISAGTAQRHATNMHLSCHRAISVRTELVGLGVPQSKLMAAGWGDQMPLVAAGPKGAAAQNRRVEIYLVPLGSTGEPGATEAGIDSGAAPVRQPEINK
jgi:chemotaxis protein MotB